VSTQGREAFASLRLNTTVPHPARRYNYWLGGKDNFAPDRKSGDAIAAVFPQIRTAARANRDFLRRAVTTLAKEAGIRQFLDIGTGLPTANNTHEVAQKIDPTSRVVYVDNDPLVLIHARALLTSAPEGATTYLDADVRNPGEILDAAAVRSTLDFSKPIALMLVAILHFIPDEDQPHQVVSQLVNALPPGSYVVISHATYDPLPQQVIDRLLALPASSGPFHPRSRQEFARFLADLELISPGIVSIADWRAEEEDLPRPTPADVICYGAVARVPNRR
jgi:hypothetical protein